MKYYLSAWRIHHGFPFEYQWVDTENNEIIGPTFASKEEAKEWFNLNIKDKDGQI